MIISTKWNFDSLVRVNVTTIGLAWIELKVLCDTNKYEVVFRILISKSRNTATESSYREQLHLHKDSGVRQS